MNIDKKLLNNSHGATIGGMKEDLKVCCSELKEAINELFAVRHEQLQRINEEKRVLRAAKQKINNEILRRKEQKKRTYDLFKSVLLYLNERAQNNVDLSSKCIMKSYVYETIENNNGVSINTKRINPKFRIGYLNLDVLHSLCYENNVNLTIDFNRKTGVAYMIFEVNPTKKVSDSLYNKIRTNNLIRMQEFYNLHPRAFGDKEKKDLEKNKTKIKK